MTATATETPKITAEQFIALIEATIPMTRDMPFRVVSLGWGMASTKTICLMVFI